MIAIVMMPDGGSHQARAAAEEALKKSGPHVSVHPGSSTWLVATSMSVAQLRDCIHTSYPAGEGRVSVLVIKLSNEASAVGLSVEKVGTWLCENQRHF